MNNVRRPNYFAVLPARVRYDNELSSTAKLMYAEISAMSDERGYCWAANKYLADLFGVDERTVRRLVNQLEERGYIQSEVLRDDRGVVSERRIWLAEPGVVVTPEKYPPPDKNVPTPPDKNVPTLRTKMSGDIRLNNINNNNPPIMPPQGGQGENSPQGVKSPRKKPSAREHKDRPDWQPELFAKLWEWYPGDRALHDKRGNKQKAIRAWDNLHPAPELVNTIADTLSRQSKAPDWQRGIGIPHLSTYLNNYGWEGWEEADGFGR